jgi:ligand-binding SRPBCC domain-containing protein
MTEHFLEWKTAIPAHREAVFAFFSDAANLERLTPRSLGFRILTQAPIAMAEGTLIDYAIRLHGIPMRWRTRICNWDPPSGFIDEQIKGPYRKWVHQHIFEETLSGTIMADRVCYALPLAPLGELAFPLVCSELQKIFARKQY